MIYMVEYALIIKDKANKDRVEVHTVWADDWNEAWHMEAFVQSLPNVCITVVSGPHFETDLPDSVLIVSGVSGHA